MAKLTIVKPADRQAELDRQSKAGAKTLAGGLMLPEGTHKFVVAEKKAFGILNVESAASGSWALPIVAGTMTVDGKAIEFELSDAPGAKTLVIQDSHFVTMKANGAYNITIGSRKGRKVVTDVVAIDAVPAGEDDE